MTASKKLLARRLAALTVAAVTLMLAFGGIAIAAPAPAPSDCAWQDCDVATPVLVDPDPVPPEPPEPDGPAEPTEPSVPAPSDEAQPTEAPTPPVEPTTAQPATPTETQSTSDPGPVREASAENATLVRSALLAGLAATLLGGGWLGTALLRRLRHEE